MSIIPVTSSEFAEFSRYINLINAIPGYEPSYEPPVLAGTDVIFRSTISDEFGLYENLYIQYTAQGYQLVRDGVDQYDPQRQTRGEIFARFDWAGHYLLRYLGDQMRAWCQRNPLNWMFLGKPLAQGFATRVSAPGESTTWLIDDPESYFISNSSFSAQISCYINISYAKIYELLLHHETYPPAID